MTAVIISGGTISPDFLREQLLSEHYDLLIAADKGLEACLHFNLMPDILLGDFDSVSPEIYEYYKQNTGTKLYEFPKKKDDTDTELAIHCAISNGAKEILLYGASGTRLDHTLANISLLKIGLDANVAIELRDANNRIRLLTDHLHLSKQTQFGNYISLLPMTERVEDICLTGFCYPLMHGTLIQGGSLGISNVLEEETGDIYVEKGILIVIESRD